MWRIIKETNSLTGQTRYVIEKKSGFIFKSWTRDYRIGNTSYSSPIKSYTKERAKQMIEVLKSGVVIDNTPIEDIV